MGLQAGSSFSLSKKKMASESWGSFLFTSVYKQCFDVKASCRCLQTNKKLIELVVFQQVFFEMASHESVSAGYRRHASL